MIWFCHSSMLQNHPAVHLWLAGDLGIQNKFYWFLEKDWMWKEFFFPFILSFDFCRCSFGIPGGQSCTLWAAATTGGRALWEWGSLGKGIMKHSQGGASGSYNCAFFVGSSPCDGWFVTMMLPNKPRFFFSKFLST